jgi:hypothetical protein
MFGWIRHYSTKCRSGQHTEVLPSEADYKQIYDMFCRVTCIKGLVESAGHRLTLRNYSALHVKTRNSTTAATEFLQREWNSARPYEEIPGPKPLPVFGNLWRFLPHIGKEMLHRFMAMLLKLVVTISTDTCNIKETCSLSTKYIYVLHIIKKK